MLTSRLPHAPHPPPHIYLSASAAAETETKQIQHPTLASPHPSPFHQFRISQVKVATLNLRPPGRTTVLCKSALLIIPWKLVHHEGVRLGFGVKGFGAAPVDVVLFGGGEHARLAQLHRLSTRASSVKFAISSSHFRLYVDLMSIRCSVH